MSTAPAPLSPNRRRSRYVLYGALGVVALLAVLIGGLAWYASTADFQNRLRKIVIAELDKATGGRTELGGFNWRLTHFEFEVDNLTIHGLEAANEVPYAHLDRLYVRLKLLSFFRPKIDLSYLEADHPVFHLIIYPDGSTNQPRPKTTSSSNKSVTDQIFDLAINRTEVRNGVALINQKAIPFNLAANDLGIVVTYSRLNGHYLGVIHAEDITAQRGKNPAVHSQLDLKLDAGRNVTNLQSFQLRTGSSVLNATASLNNFADPKWKLSAEGKIDVREVEALASVPGLERGIAELNLKGQGTKSVFSIDGRSNVTGASYRQATVNITGANAETTIHMTQDELALTGIHARLPFGGKVDGDLRILHWLHGSVSLAKKDRVPSKTTPVASQQGIIRVQIAGFNVASIMSIVAPPQYRDLGFDSVATGKVNVDWLGSSDNLTVVAQVALAPSNTPVPDQVPLRGTVDATYMNRNGTVDIRTFEAQTPATQIHITGALGVYPIERRASQINADLVTSNLGEFNRTLIAMGLSANGRTGVQAIPAQLHGQAQFHGQVTGSLLDPDVKGHLDAKDFDLVFHAPAPQAAKEEVTQTQSQSTAAAPTTVHWDSLNADAEYSSELIAIQKATLARGKTVIHLNGQIHAHHLSTRRKTFDEDSPIQAAASIQNASVADLLLMAGQDLPVSGTLNLQAHTDGTIGNLSGGGHAAIQGGSIYGEPYRNLSADLRFAGHDLSAQNLVLALNGGQLTGNGGYDIAAKKFHFDAQGKEFNLAHLQHVKNAKYTLGGTLAFETHGSGTIDAPDVEANLHLTNLNLANQAAGFIDADAHTQSGSLILNANAHLNNAVIQVQGQTELSGNYSTRAHLTLTQLDIDPVLRMFNVSQVKGHSSIGATADVSGPLKQPKLMNGEATISQFSISLEGIPLKSDGPLHAKLQNGLLHLDPLHITGGDTNLRAQGTLNVFEKPHALDMQASGNINAKLAQSFDSNIIASGRVDFDVAAQGTVEKPNLGGQVKFTDVTVSYETFPNGLSKMNGILAFDQDRLDFKNVTAYSGGGLIQIGGFITYQQGIYGDLTATAKDVRIRYPTGFSSMADAKLRLQGTPKSMLLSGNVQITRFAIGQDLDLASFTGSAASVTLPPDPDAPSNRVRLDIHIASAPSLDFQNSYAKLAGDVNLRVQGTVAQPSILGHITITEGSATFAGTKYELQHGDIFFTNPVRIDPVIDIDAIARVESYDITIGLHGTPSKLSPNFRSEPPLSEQDIFSLLAMGRTQEEQQIYSQEQANAGVNSTADALLGGALNATVSSRIQKLFGGGSVKIDPTFVSGTGNATARITVQQQVSKYATLTYATNVNSTAQQLIQGEIKVTQNISVLAVRDEASVFSLILRLHRRYR